MTAAEFGGTSQKRDVAHRLITSLWILRKLTTLSRYVEYAVLFVTLKSYHAIQKTTHLPITDRKTPHLALRKALVFPK